MLAAHQMTVPAWVQAGSMNTLLEIFRDEINLALP